MAILETTGRLRRHIGSIWHWRSSQHFGSSCRLFTVPLKSMWYLPPLVGYFGSFKRFVSMGWKFRASSRPHGGSSDIGEEPSLCWSSAAIYSCLNSQEKSLHLLVAGLWWNFIKTILQSKPGFHSACDLYQLSVNQISERQPQRFRSGYDVQIRIF